LSAKKWIKLFFVFNIFNIFFISAINYTIDPFNIFHTQFLKHQFQMNERFIKVEYLEKHNKEFDSYLFGSSRIGTTKPSVVEHYITNSKFYNFTLSSATLYDYLIHLRYFIKQHYSINTLYVQIDMDSMSFYGISKYDYMKKPHPHIFDNSLVQYYVSYLIGLFPSNMKGKIKINIDYNESMRYFLNKGFWVRENDEVSIDKDCKIHSNNISKFPKNYTRILSYTKKSQNIKALKEIIKLSKDNNIKLILFIAPLNKSMMDKFVLDGYLKYLKDISEVTNFYDFSGYNSITINNCNYYEESHYRPLVAKLIAGRIFNDKSIQVPDDFGIYITKDNINMHLQNIKKQIIDYNPI